MKILAIETSCDETAICILEAKPNPKNILGNIAVLGNSVSSQASLHAEFGGVYPSLAKREHAKNIVPVLIDVLNQAGINTENKINLTNNQQAELLKLFEHEPELYEIFIKHMPQIQSDSFDYICITTGPGLAPALWVGVNFAKALSIVFGLPTIPINHMEGHILSPLLATNANFPALALLISGGHTEIIYAEGLGNYKKIGQTLDDAIGETYDKTARLLGLPYPGGPQIAKLASHWRNTPPESRQMPPIEVELPRPMIHSNDLNFSFSGLKTSVLYTLKKLEEFGLLDETVKTFFAAEFEQAVTDVLVKKMLKAIEQNPIKTVLVGGGVSANNYIKESLVEAIKNYDENIVVMFPDQEMSTDNAIMIGMAGIAKISINFNENKKLGDIVAQANWEL